MLKSTFEGGGGTEKEYCMYSFKNDENDEPSLIIVQSLELMFELTQTTKMASS